jgi:hypothetical protein
MSRLSEFVETHIGNTQLGAFLRHKCPASDLDEPAVPVFYGIPKIHKHPTKIRPIVLCHSTAQGLAAKFVSKQLKPLLDARPYVLHGSKDLAERLAAIHVPRHRKVWLISGDIVAFYPNIPTQRCVDIVNQWWLSENAEESVASKHLFTSAVRLVFRNLIFDFMSSTYRQKRGLAMGIACSPNAANLYGAYFEQKILPDPDFLFFGRYIDDVLGVVFANSKEDAMAIAQRIQYEGVELEWSVSEFNTR